MSDSNVPPTAVAGSSAEAQAAAFAADDRIHYDKTSGTWRLEDDDGNEMEFDAAKGVWVPLVSSSQLVMTRSARVLTASKLSEDLLKAQQAAYSVVGVDEEVRLEYQTSHSTH
jgi:HIV Tat-specific factor 1